MGEQTAISWCDSTANLWIGCTKQSPACDGCYAEDLMATTGSRFKRVEWGPKGERLFCKSGWADIRTWQRRAAANDNRDPVLGRRRRIFINSLSDFFDNHRSVVWRDDAWKLIRECPGLIFILVTKRPQLISRMLPPFWDEIAERVWVITTAENQEWADRRIPDLLESWRGRARPAVLGISVEPILGEIDLTNVADDGTGAINALNGDVWCVGKEGPVKGEKLDWVIVGGESGDEARPMHPRWVRDLRDQCAKAGVAFHFKQWGEWGPAIGTREGDVIFHDPHPDYPDSDGFIRIATTVRRIGKAKTGRELCGREHLEFPLAA